MLLFDLYRKILQTFYKSIFDGPCKKLMITGFIRTQNSKSVYVGNNVIIKSGAALLPGKKSSSIKIGDFSEIHESCVLRTFDGYIKIGTNSSINMQSIFLGAGGIEIGNFVRIGPRSTIITNNHIFVNREVPISKQGVDLGPVFIEDDVWIGANVTLLPNIRVSHGSVIAAGAVVTKDVAPFSIVAGVPAKKIGSR